MGVLGHFAWYFNLFNMKLMGINSIDPPMAITQFSPKNVTWLILPWWGSIRIVHYFRFGNLIIFKTRMYLSNKVYSFGKPAHSRKGP